MASSSRACRPAQRIVRIVGKVGFDEPPDDRAFQVSEGGTRSDTPKMTIPAPPVLHFRGGRKAISKKVYPDWTTSSTTSAEAYRKAVKAFYDAGCRYLQLDDTVWAYLCSKKKGRSSRDRGEDPDKLPASTRA